jgi:elongation factor P hydroxylase
MPNHDYADLITLFDGCFFDKFNTRLVKGGHEPIYIPSGNSVDGYRIKDYHQILFAHGFYRSALHEVAHWLVAGDLRRLKVDYGYWYAPDGRNAEQQSVFERVEVKPQAIEWILTKACRHTFTVSVDNLSGEPTDPLPFKQSVFDQVLALQRNGMSLRAETFRQSLAMFYGTPSDLDAVDFSLNEL